MRFDLNVDYPTQRMHANRRRMEARAAFEYVDRVPVGFCLAPRYFTPLFDAPYNAIFESAEEQYYWQLQFLRYRIENIPEDCGFEEGAELQRCEPGRQSAKARFRLGTARPEGGLRSRRSRA